MTDKSLECYNILFQKRSAGKDEKGIDQCYKDMLGYAEQNNNAPLAIAMRKTLYFMARFHKSSKNSQ